ncbi:MAG: hypothetical protein GYA59_10135, partial [Chloroflexi bacterium]|nr:hypothetical protein [Chloroflexota bacterium]
LWRYNQTWQYVQPITDGRTLQQMGVKPGPIYASILERLRAAWLDGEVTRETEEKDLLSKLLESGWVPPSEEVSEE